MNLNHLAVFHAVAEAGGVTAGAERLMVSQPAVSKQVRLLEREMGVALFERIGRGMRVTEAGEVLAGYARRIFGLVEEGEQAVGDLQSLKRGKIRVGVSATAGAYLLPRLLVRMRQRFPGVEVKVEVGNAELLGERLEARGVDFVLTEGRVMGVGLKARVFLEEELVVIAKRGHELAKRRGVTWADIREEVWVARDAGEGEPLVERVAGRGNRGMLVLGSTEGVKEAVAEGLGVAVVPRMVVGDGGRVVILKMKERLPRRSFYYVRVEGRRESKAEVAFGCLLKHVGRGGLPPLGGKR